ncbi:unnamed protein product [Rhizophagus irregularis]|uniref:Uncharacterized protein n=1 Tax=Rhizophagus irregularis TaxID=588596 RepID=A0A916EI91_9GLOM|nr:unnamed protein product [Rhizophagus irregularis]CAB4474406.1 unnamed protein product [Rhizophagus irregularis]CAB5366117.1 unnamed protein product [Rhizophagus irregularis]CAB5390523.1 unnamed protein product [Rhizophagus irregularis]
MIKALVSNIEGHLLQIKSRLLPVMRNASLGVPFKNDRVFLLHVKQDAKRLVLIDIPDILFRRFLRRIFRRYVV